MVIALIPARGGSERIPGKNIRELAGHPLLAYTIAAAQHAKIFDGIYVSTEDPATQAVAIKYGAQVIKRPAELSRANSVDIEWLIHALVWIREQKGHESNPEPTQFMILRPSNPFRTRQTIERAWRMKPVHEATSLRSVSPIGEHPQKMWRFRAGYLTPYEYRLELGGLPCDVATQSLEGLWVQNGCIQIASDRIVALFGNYTGAMVAAFFCDGYEGFDINTEEDWILAEALIDRGLARLEPIDETITIQSAAAN